MEVKLMTERKGIVKPLALLLAAVITVAMLPINVLEVKAGGTPITIRFSSPSECLSNGGHIDSVNNSACELNESDGLCDWCGASMGSGGNTPSSGGSSSGDTTPSTPSSSSSTQENKSNESSSTSVTAVQKTPEQIQAEIEEFQNILREEEARNREAAQKAKDDQIRQEEAARAAEAQKAIEEAQKVSEQNAQLPGTIRYQYKVSLKLDGADLEEYRVPINDDIQKREYERYQAVLRGSSVEGAYTAQSVEGTVITTSQEQLKENFNLKEGESLRVVTWDTTAQNSPDAMRSLEQAAKGIGGELGPAITVTIKKTSSGANPALKTIIKVLLQDFKGIGPAVGAVNTDDWADYLSDKPDDQSFLAKYNEAMKETLKLDLNSENYANEVKAVFEKYGLGGPDEALSRLEDIRNEVDEFTKARGSAEMTVGVPQSFQSEGSTIVVAKVLPGGKTEILQDKDTIPGIVSFDVTEGEATYALVKKTNDTTAPEIEKIDYSKGSTVLGKAGLGLAKYMYDSVNEVATPEEKSLIDNMQKANDEYSALDTSGMNSAEVEDARDAIFQKYGFVDSSDAAEKVGDIMEKYNII